VFTGGAPSLLEDPLFAVPRGEWLLRLTFAAVELRARRLLVFDQKSERGLGSLVPVRVVFLVFRVLLRAHDTPLAADLIAKIS